MSLGTRLRWSVVGCLLALLLALAAAHFYQPPNLVGSPAGNEWFESDVLCSLGSSLLASGVGWWSGRQTVKARAFKALATRTLIWLGLTVLLFAVWSQFVFLLTLLIAPTHAFACLRVANLWQTWRSELAWERTRSRP